ncbi:Ig-like domain-containing domain [Rhodonellum sp.]|uniref:Ig-like domain-containing domain n=1 Tax=Rhodonellum sp. TaxID=2231180 RepID=UPI0027214D3B|nr:Ig-like domain-containing domain [Rhodonellum sp.]MDO9552637.1 Ig-like domain-containing domain [Rhodonellum sp.]
MGGPKDLDPPKLLETNPKNNAVNIRPSTIILDFDEYINIENPNKQVIITPRIKKDEMQVLAVKNRVTMKLNQELEDNTTYVFNFQKSITDITEKNPAENLKLVFSTGENIDSLTFSGKVNFLFPQRERNMKDVLVGLYPLSDTTDVLSGPPYYIGQADTLGRFEITNIKAGAYSAYAWHDTNNSLKAEDKTEPYGFLDTEVNITDNIDDAQFYISKADLSPIKINRSSPVGTNYDIILSKTITEVEVEHPDIHKKLFYRIKDKNMRFYHTDFEGDSTAIGLVFKDSVGFKKDTMVFAKFQESDRSKEKLESTINSGTNFVRKFTSEITFNKPIKKITLDSLFVKYDTASILPIKREWIYLKDSSDFTKIYIDIAIPDSLKNEVFTVYSADSTFFDVEGLTNENKIEGTYRKLKKEVLADALRVKINSNRYPLIIQLLNNKDQLVKEEYLKDKNEIVFMELEAGTYRVRIIEDLNGNRRWDPSNLTEKRQAEPIYYHINSENDNSRDIILKAGWDNEITINPLNPIGLGLLKNGENEPSPTKDEENQPTIL